MPKTRPRSQRKLSEAQVEAVARRFRALGMPSRLRILDALMQGPLSMAALTDATGLTQSNLSRQVTGLEGEGLVQRSRNGREVEVEICDASVGELCRLVCDSVAARAASNHELLRG